METNEIATKGDLEKATKLIMDYLSSKIEGTQPKKILRSSDVKKLLGISTGSLQNLRITRKLKFSKINGTIFYNYDDVINLLDTAIVEKSSIVNSQKTRK